MILSRRRFTILGIEAYLGVFDAGWTSGAEV
jgi:hypothetical protein